MIYYYHYYFRKKLILSKQYWFKQLKNIKIIKANSQVSLLCRKMKTIKTAKYQSISQENIYPYIHLQKYFEDFGQTLQVTQHYHRRDLYHMMISLIFSYYFSRKLKPYICKSKKHCAYPNRSLNELENNHIHIYTHEWMFIAIIIAVFKTC